jgi:hypothetical protein
MADRREIVAKQDNENTIETLPLLISQEVQWLKAHSEIG